MDDPYRAPASDSEGDDLVAPERALARGRELLLAVLALPFINVPLELFVAPNQGVVYYLLALSALSYLVYQGHDWAKRLLQAWCALMIVAHLGGITALSGTRMAVEVALAVAHAVTLVTLWRSTRVAHFLRQQRAARLARKQL